MRTVSFLPVIFYYCFSAQEGTARVHSWFYNQPFVWTAGISIERPQSFLGVCERLTWLRSATHLLQVMMKHRQWALVAIIRARVWYEGRAGGILWIGTWEWRSLRTGSDQRLFKSSGGNGWWSGRVVQSHVGTSSVPSPSFQQCVAQTAWARNSYSMFNTLR